MELGLAGKRAIVTGGSRGIGRACALALAREGARVMICGRSAADVDGAVAEIGGEYAGHRSFVADLAATDGPSEFVAAAKTAGFGEPDIVVQNVGGTLGIRDPFAPAPEWRHVWRLNVEVAVELTNAFAPVMQRRGSGRIVFVSSVAAFEQQGSTAYGVAKAALTAYARGIGKVLASDGIVVCAVVPGVTLTEGGPWARYLQDDPEGVKRFIAEKLPRGRLGTAEEIADAVVFLASERASAFVGSVVAADGGQAAGAMRPIE